MALSDGLQAVSDILDEVENDPTPTTYNRENETKLVNALRGLITEIDLVENP